MDARTWSSLAPHERWNWRQNKPSPLRSTKRHASISPLLDVVLLMRRHRCAR
jgi:hypothetical protein